MREKVLVFIGGGNLGGEDVGKELRGAEIHIHPVRMKEVKLTRSFLLQDKSRNYLHFSTVST